MNISKVDTLAYYVNLGIVVSWDVHIHVACNVYKAASTHVIGLACSENKQTFVDYRNVCKRIPLQGVEGVSLWEVWLLWYDCMYWE